MTDHISNMLISIKNASMAGKPFVEVLHTKQIEQIAKVMQNAGFLSNVKTFKEGGQEHKKLHLELSYSGKIPSLSDVKRYSKPGRRIFKGYEDIRKVAGGFGLLIVSTPRGIMNGDEARKKKLGGEIICEVR